MMRAEETLLTWVPRLRRYARALVSKREDADDLVQDTLERAWTKSAQWSGVGDMRAWLFSVMHNVHVDRLRKAVVPTVSLDEVSEELLAPSAQAQRHEAMIEVVSLQSALDRLPVEQKEVVLLVALEGLSYAEVAKVLMIPEGTVMSRLARGRERLRVLLERGESFADDATAASGAQRLKVVKS